MGIKSYRTIPVYFQLLVVVYMLHTSVPIVGFYTPAIVHAGVVLSLYFFLFSRKELNIAAAAMYVLPIFGIYILSLLYGGPSHLITYIYGMLQIFVYPLISLYLIRIGNRKVARRLFFIIGLSYMITGITTYTGCQMYPNASRDIAAMLTSEDPELYAMYMSHNIGSFSFIYTLVLILPLLIYLIRDRKINLLAGISCLVIIVLAVFASEFATAFLFMLISMMTFFLPIYFKKKQIAWLFIGMFVFFMVGKSYLGQTLNWTASVVESEIVSDRLENLALFFIGEDTQNVEGDIESRMDLYEHSLEAFRASPIWGNSHIPVGGHSYMLDNLGSYGLLGLLAMIMMYRRLFNAFYRSCRNQKWYGYTCFVFVVALAFAALNPKDNLGVLTFIVPLFMTSFWEEKTCVEYESTLDRK